MDKRYLHLGCGSVILPSPFENMDVRDLPGVDHLGEVYPLKFRDAEFDLVYCSHVLEHFNRHQTQDIIEEWVRVLKPGGTLRLAVPSLEGLIEIYEKSGKMENVIGPFMGGQTYEQNYHYMLFDTKTLTNFMEKAGLTAIHPWDYRRTEHADFWDFSQAETYGISISLNLEGRKRIEANHKKKALEEIGASVQLLLACNDHDKNNTYSDALYVIREALGDE